MKVLIIQIRQLGDILLSSPLARALKENLTSCEVHFLTSSIGKEILKGNPFIDKIIQIEKGITGELKTLMKIRQEKYDAIIDVQRTGRSQRLTFLSGAPLRIAFEKPLRNLPYNTVIKWENRSYTVWERIKLIEGLEIKIKNYQKYLPEFFNYQEVKGMEVPEKFFTVVPTARKPEKMWEIRNFAQLIDKLYKKLYIPAVILYGPGEKKIVENLASETTKAKIFYPEKPLPIGESAAIIKKSLFFIGLNSFSSHLAVASKKKTIVIDRRNSGWFPPTNTVKEVYNKGKFPEVDDVLNAVLSFIN